MPTTNARKHVIPTGTEQSVSRAMFFDAFANSIRDAIPVANATERAQVVSALTAAGQSPAVSRPVIVYRADAPGLHKLEVSTNGTLWLALDGSLRFADAAAMNTWTASNPGMLVAGDRAWAGGLEYVYSGTQWLVAPGQQLAYMTANSGVGVTDSVIGTVVSTIVLPVNQPLIVRSSRISGSASAAGPINFLLKIRNHATEVSSAAFDKAVPSRAYQGGGSLAVSIPAAETKFITTTAARVTAALFLGSGVWVAFGADGQELWIESA